METREILNFLILFLVIHILLWAIIEIIALIVATRCRNNRKDKIIGHAVFRLWPVNQIGIINNIYCELWMGYG